MIGLFSFISFSLPHKLTHTCTCAHTHTRLYMVTWNVGTAEPPPDVDSLLQLDAQPVDLYVIG